jgi:hypothetical protein
MLGGIVKMRMMIMNKQCWASGEKMMNPAG